MAPADKPEEIKRKDRRIAGQTNAYEKSAGDRHFIDLIRRYVPGIKDVELSASLDFEACPVPGSYAADIRATVHMLSGETKQFSMLYAKRYDQVQLDAKMQKSAGFRSPTGSMPRNTTHGSCFCTSDPDQIPRPSDIRRYVVCHLVSQDVPVQRLLIYRSEQ